MLRCVPLPASYRTQHQKPLVHGERISARLLSLPRHSWGPMCQPMNTAEATVRLSQHATIRQANQAAVALFPENCIIAHQKRRRNCAKAFFRDRRNKSL
jgi:hypothetical protein